MLQCTSVHQLVHDCICLRLRLSISVSPFIYLSVSPSVYLFFRFSVLHFKDKGGFFFLLRLIPLPFDTCRSPLWSGFPECRSLYEASIKLVCIIFVCFLFKTNIAFLLTIRFVFCFFSPFFRLFPVDVGSVMFGEQIAR